MMLGRMSLAIFLFLGGSLNSVAGQRPIYPDLPSPRLVLVGPTGAGKSSLANAFVGCDPRSDDCLFNVCSSLDSCTKDTTYGMGPWLGTGQNFTVVDTPGFGDSDNQDEELIEEMMDVLANTIHHSDTMLLVLDGRLTRFNDGLQTMLKRMTMMFGEDWWDYVVIGVSFWAYDQASIEARKCEPEYPQYCKDEEWYSNEITTQLNEKFNKNKTFTFVFTDSWSQTPGPPGHNTEDPLQQEHWQAETKILWDITIGRDNSFDFMTINDFMEENARQKAEIKWLNDVITFNITEMTERIAVNEAQIFENTEQMSALRLSPVGTITAWVSKPNKNSGNFLDQVPDGWLRCDGSIIPEPSIWAGDYLPNLNGEKRFLRGGVDGDALNLEEDMLLDHKHDLTDPGHSHDVVDPEHSHGLVDPTHSHDVVDPEHSHVVVDPKHSHGLNDPGHHHAYSDYYNDNGQLCSCMGGVDGVQDHSGRSTGYSKSGISMDNTNTGISMESKSTGISMKNTKTGISMESKSTGISIKSTIIGITVDNVSSTIGQGTETRPKNMCVIYIMRVW